MYDLAYEEIQSVTYLANNTLLDERVFSTIRQAMLEDSIN
jgi:hypothetical protein